MVLEVERAELGDDIVDLLDDRHRILGYHHVDGVEEHLDGRIEQQGLRSDDVLAEHFTTFGLKEGKVLPADVGDDEDGVDDVGRDVGDGLEVGKLVDVLRAERQEGEGYDHADQDPSRVFGRGS